MIIWINGAFGVGKTQTAYELQRRMSDAFVYDPENAGFFIRKNIPQLLHRNDFQDHSIWRIINRDVLCYIAEQYTGNIIIPMTITNDTYYHEITDVLIGKFAVKHIILCAEKKTILKRLTSRFEGNQSWAAQQIDRCISAFDEEITGEKIYTDHMSIEQVVEKIAALTGIALRKDTRKPYRKMIDRIVTQFRHIR